MFNIFIFLKDDYTEDINSVFYNYSSDCTLFIVTEVI